MAPTPLANSVALVTGPSSGIGEATALALAAEGAAVALVARRDRLMKVAEAIADHVGGVLNVIRAALPHLVEAALQPPRRVAGLVNISSTGGRVARPGTGVYSLTKFVTRDRHVAVNEILIRAGEQTR